MTRRPRYMWSNNRRPRPGRGLAGGPVQGSPSFDIQIGPETLTAGEYTFVAIARSGAMSAYSYETLLNGVSLKGPDTEASFQLNLPAGAGGTLQVIARADGVIVTSLSRTVASSLTPPTIVITTDTSQGSAGTPIEITVALGGSPAPTMSNVTLSATFGGSAITLTPTANARKFTYTPSGAGNLVINGSVTLGGTTVNATTLTVPVSATAVAPINTAVPTVSTSGYAGDPVYGSEGAWSGSPAPTITLTWQRQLDESGPIETVEGETSLTLSATSAMVGYRYRIVPKAVNSAAPSGVEQPSSWTIVLAASQQSEFYPAIAPVDLTAPTGASRFPLGNYANLGTVFPALRGNKCRVYQPRANLTFPASDVASAFFAIVRHPMDQRRNTDTPVSNNTPYRAIFSNRHSGGISAGNFFLRFRCFGASGSSNVFEVGYNGSTSGSSISSIVSPQWTEDEALVVWWRDGAGNTGVDWYSLKDGTRFEGAVTSGRTPGAINPSSGVFGLGYAAESNWPGTTTWPSSDGTNIAAFWENGIRSVGLISNYAVTPSQWSDIARGARIRDVVPVANIPYIREFDGTPASYAAPAWATPAQGGADQTSPMQDVGGVSATGVGGQPLKPGTTIGRQSLANYVVADVRTDGFVYGLVSGQSQRDIPFAATASGIVEVKVYEADTGAVVRDWTELSGYNATTKRATGNIALPAGDGSFGGAGGFYFYSMRLKANPSIQFHCRDRFGVGWVFWGVGQSNINSALEGTISDTNQADVSQIDDSYGITYLNQVNTGNPTTDWYSGRSMQVQPVGTKSQWLTLVQFGNVIRRFAPKIPVMYVNDHINGAGPGGVVRGETDAAHEYKSWQDEIHKAADYGNVVTGLILWWDPDWLDALVYNSGPKATGRSFANILAPGYKALAISTAKSTNVNPGSMGDYSGEPQSFVDWSNSWQQPVGVPLIDTFGTNGHFGRNRGRWGEKMAYMALRGAGVQLYLPYFKNIRFNADRSKILLDIQLRNDGQVWTNDPTDVRCAYVRRAGTTYWYRGGQQEGEFLAALVGDRLELTRIDGQPWAEEMQVQLMGAQMYHVDDAEQTIQENNQLYEKVPNVGHIRGIPISGVVVDGNWSPTAVTTVSVATENPPVSPTTVEHLVGGHQVASNTTYSFADAASSAGSSAYIVAVGASGAHPTVVTIGGVAATAIGLGSTGSGTKMSFWGVQSAPNGIVVATFDLAQSYCVTDVYKVSNGDVLAARSLNGWHSLRSLYAKEGSAVLYTTAVINNPNAAVVTGPVAEDRSSAFTAGGWAHRWKSMSGEIATDGLLEIASRWYTQNANYYRRSFGIIVPPLGANWTDVDWKKPSPFFCASPPYSVANGRPIKLRAPGGQAFTVESCRVGGVMQTVNPTTGEFVAPSAGGPLEAVVVSGGVRHFISGDVVPAVPLISNPLWKDEAEGNGLLAAIPPYVAPVGTGFTVTPANAGTAAGVAELRAALVAARATPEIPLILEDIDLRGGGILSLADLEMNGLHVICRSLGGVKVDQISVVGTDNITLTGLFITGQIYGVPTYGNLTGRYLQYSRYALNDTSQNVNNWTMGQLPRCVKFEYCKSHDSSSGLISAQHIANDIPWLIVKQCIAQDAGPGSPGDIGQYKSVQKVYFQNSIWHDSMATSGHVDCIQFTEGVSGLGYSGFISGAVLMDRKLTGEKGAQSGIQSNLRHADTLFEDILVRIPGGASNGMRLGVSTGNTVIRNNAVMANILVNGATANNALIVKDNITAGATNSIRVVSGIEDEDGTELPSTDMAAANGILGTEDNTRSVVLGGGMSVIYPAMAANDPLNWQLFVPPAGSESWEPEIVTKLKAVA